jgi:hypothetical protein
VIFAGEEGYDAGGVKKELFLLLMRELLSPDYGMFSVDPEVGKCCDMLGDMVSQSLLTFSLFTLL